MPAEALDTRAWLLAAGFALHSLGIPFTTVALFTLLARWAGEHDVAWWAAAALAGAATVAGHAIVFVAARVLGTASVRAAVRRWTAAGEIIQRVEGMARSPGGWWALTAWRWVGPGFAQAFWVLCALPRLDGRLWALLAYLTVHDLLWAVAWTYALVVLHLAAPVVALWLDRLAWALLVAGLLWAARTWWTGRVHRAPRAAHRSGKQREAGGGSPGAAARGAVAPGAGSRGCGAPGYETEE